MHTRAPYNPVAVTGPLPPEPLGHLLSYRATHGIVAVVLDENDADANLLRHLAPTWPGRWADRPKHSKFPNSDFQSRPGLSDKTGIHCNFYFDSTESVTPATMLDDNTKVK